VNSLAFCIDSKSGPWHQMLLQQNCGLMYWLTNVNGWADESTDIWIFRWTDK